MTLAAGFLLILTLYFYLVHPLVLKQKWLERERESLAQNIERHQKYLAPDYQPPSVLTHMELRRLEERIPLNRRDPGYVVDIERAVKSSGADFLKLESLADLHQIARQDTAEQSEARPVSEEELMQQLGMVVRPELVPSWVQLEVKANQKEFASLLDQLQKSDRLVSVIGWDYQWADEHTEDKGVIYLAVYSYHDQEVKK
ncbi:MULTISPECIES: hypothetical protein [Thermoactinomyces]|jgi:hypothetical protein|uniref:hypothetical protein n=1 Tax=Thermoactinomyces TaxID=2023 RepID=UPI000507768C|nr:MULTISPECIES: hypothetical protein [Thermoactinomyces]KFZ39536.1 hypothetical protein JS81_13350 [Thermoactinomyces sp. Gus2-1]KYQ86250.1 hypothetical protein AYX07_09405 [Thermoactinomyces sp. AS95]MBA4550988.1 hypothetical protein [Thermoactinomyces vulgaris]MBA4597053.1 hypothetical protein [Thermoactinomyces vulgaris]MBH8583532.1 hypothetical protein [Thermoactinomyces sp. CICC 10735]